MIRDLLVAGALLIASLLVVSRHVAPSLPADVGARIELAWEVQARRAFDEGTLPLWNPHHFGGQPHLADPRTRAFYPPHVILRFVPIELFFPTSVFLHVWLGALGAYWIGRQLHATRVAAFFGALGLLALLVPTSAAAYSSDTYAVSWLSLVVACAMRSTVKPEARRPHAGLVASTCLAVLTGSLKAALYAIGAASAIYAYAMLWPAIAASGRPRLLQQFVGLCVLTAGITAFQTLPAGHLRALSAGSLQDDDPRMQPGRATEPRADSIDASLAAALHPLKGHRTATVCERAVDPSQLAMLGIPVGGGQGGMYPTDFVRLINLVRVESSPSTRAARSGQGVEPVYRGMAGIDAPSARVELLKLLDVEYLISCDAPDARNWSLVAQLDGVAVYRNVRPARRALWTCPPRLVSRSELDDALSRLGGAVINVRWTPEVDDERRAGAESKLRLRLLRSLGDRTWQYELDDTSPEHLAVILGSPLVEDTHGIDRTARTVTSVGQGLSEAKTEWLAVANCSDVGQVRVLEGDRADGRVVLSVDAPRDGIVLLSETYYPVRGARIDGHDVTPLKLNLVFTGIPVTAGAHLIELTYKADSLRVGVGISVATLAVWAVLGGRSRKKGRQRG